ncbi:MAG: MraY family glycosyltransferase [Eubacteriales bacterium]|nr:MraY family glycosyltransferase [Eubacteriales bacterium]
MKYLMIILLSFAISCVVTPFAIKIAPRIGAMDVPRDKRRMHTKPMPRFGGISMFLGTEISLALFLHSDPKVIAIIIGGACIYAVGAADDIRGLPAKVKLALQILSAIVIYVGGIQIDFVRNPFNQHTYLFFPSWLSFIITIIWIVGITNTINLIDGLDGLAAGVAAIASGCIAYSAILSGQFEVGLAMFAVSGGAIGFLPYNFHPAKIFMGDSGSLYLGFMIAAVSILGSTKGATLIATIVPFLVLGLPIFDTAFAIIRRWVNGYPIMEADKGHLHHRIMNTGIGQRRTVLIMYCISAIMGMVAVLVVQRMFIESIVLILVAAVLTCVFIADRDSMKEILKEGIPPEKIGMLNHKSKENEHNSSDDVSSADAEQSAQAAEPAPAAEKKQTEE